MLPSLKVKLLTSVFFVLLLCGGESFAATAIPLELGKLHHDAQHIFYGECIANQVGEDEVTGIPVMYTTFTVLTSLRGEVSGVHTIKQLGGGAPGNDGATVTVDVPRFAIGQDQAQSRAPAKTPA